MEAEISILKARLQARCVTSGVSHITSENLFALLNCRLYCPKPSLYGLDVRSKALLSGGALGIEVLE